MKSSAPKRKTKKEFSIVYCLQRRICLVCHSSIEESKLGDDSFVDEAAVAAVMGLFNCSYTKAVDIWTADRIAAQDKESPFILQNQSYYPFLDNPNSPFF